MLLARKKDYYTYSC